MDSQGLTGNALLAGVAASLAPPDNRPIPEWAAEKVQLIGGKGAFYDPTANPSQGFAFDWISDPTTAQLCLVWPTGSGKSVFFEVWIAHIIAEDPADCQFSHQTDRPASLWFEKRVIPTLERCPATRPILAATHRHKKRKLELSLANGVTIYAGGANMRNLQDKSVAVVGGQEVWDWPAGAIDEAKARTHDRESAGLGKIVFCGQGGPVGCDFEREALAGELFETGFRCPGCGAEVPYLPRTENPGEDFEAAFTWNEKEAESDAPDWAKLLRSVRFVTPCCGKKYRDTPNNRRRLSTAAVLIRHGGSFIPGWKTHTVTAAALHWIPWSKLVREFVAAKRAEMRGDLSPLAAFVKKRLARFYVEKQGAPELQFPEAEKYSKADYWPADPAAQAPQINLEAFRFLNVDVQLDHYWVSVRGWRLDCSSRLLYEGRIASLELVRDLQLRFSVANQNVGIDCGYEPERVAKARWKYREEIRQDGKPAGFACWVMLKGDKAESYPHHERRGGKVYARRRIWAPPVQTTTAAGVPYSFIKFSNLRAKDALAALIKGGQTGVFHDCSKEYRAHMKSEAKGQPAPGVFRWDKIRPSAQNHLWDCEVGGVVMASMRGVLQENLAEMESADQEAV